MRFLERRVVVAILAGITLGLGMTFAFGISDWVPWRSAIIIGAIAGVSIALFLPIYFYAAYGPSRESRPRIQRSGSGRIAQSLIRVAVIDVAIVLIAIALGGSLTTIATAVLLLSANLFLFWRLAANREPSGRVPREKRDPKGARPAGTSDDPE